MSLMIKRPKKPTIVPDFTEFTDTEGTKWVQTSADDLFSIKEINKILESIEKDKDEGDIVIARIDFQKVNKEYYERVRELQTKLKKKNELIKRLLMGSKETIDKKNRKLKELIEYIKKLHLLIAAYRQDPERMRDIDLPALTPVEPEPVPVVAIERVAEIPAKEFVEVEEVVLGDNEPEA